MNKFRTKAFLKLKAKFYRKLKDEGFEDIEVENDPIDRLKSWHNSYFNARYSPAEFEEKRQYYDSAGKFLNSHQFSKQQDKDVWSCHAEGMSVRKIAFILGLKCSQVQITIAELRNVMLPGYNREPDNHQAG